MKFGKYLLCGALLLGSSMLFVGCGNKSNSKPALKTISKENVTGFRDQSVIYDGDFHLAQPRVNFPGETNTRFQARYSVDGENFFTYNYIFSELDNPDTIIREFKDAGDYPIFIRIIKDGYKDYQFYTTVTIQPKDINVTLSNVRGFVDDNMSIADIKDKVSLAYSDQSQLVEGETLKFNVELGKMEGSSINNPVMYDPSKALAGQGYEILGVDMDPNYNIKFQKASFKLIDNLSIVRDGQTYYYNTLSGAIAAAQPGETIVLLRDIKVTETIKLTKSVTIDGSNKYSIKATDNFIGANDYNNKLTTSVLHIDPNNANVELKLKDVIVDCANKTRAVSAFSGKVELTNTKIVNGECVDNRRSGGVYISQSGSFVMNSGEIVGSVSNEVDYTKFCADLWIGANANGSLVSINGGKIGNVFVNANEYSANNPGSFTINGGEINNVYIEHDQGYGASFNYVAGDVENIFVSEPAGNGNAVKLSAVENTTYIGGKTDYDNVQIVCYATFNHTFNDNYPVFEEGKAYLLEGCTFNSQLVVNENIDLTLKDCVFNSASLNTGDYSAVIINKINSLTVDGCEFGGNLTVGSKATPGHSIVIDAKENIEGSIKIENNTFNAMSSINDIAISISASTGEINGKVKISNNDFKSVANEIEIGISAIDGTVSEEQVTASANFTIEISNNLTNVDVRECFKEIPSGEKSYIEIATTDSYQLVKTVNE